MPQHLWHSIGIGRICEVCRKMQLKDDAAWYPPVGPICAGDPDDGDRDTLRRRPNAPSGAPVRVLEDA